MAGMTLSRAPRLALARRVGADDPTTSTSSSVKTGELRERADRARARWFEEDSYVGPTSGLLMLGEPDTRARNAQG